MNSRDILDRVSSGLDCDHDTLRVTIPK